MKRIDEYIAELLYDHDCVILPGFGGFITSYAPARIHPRQHTMTPPGKDILFNSRLQRNDGLLANYIADVEDIRYQEAVDQLQEFVDSCFTVLQNNNELTFDNIGRFVRNDEGNLEFTPSHQINFLNDSYGMTMVVAPPVHRDPESRRPIEPVRPSKENRPLSARKIALRTVIVITPFLLLTLWGFYNSPLLKDIYTNYSGIIPLIRSASSPETPAVSKDMPVNQPVTIPADDGAPVTLPAREEEKTVTEIVPGPGNNTVEAEEEYTFTETPTASEPPKQEEVKPVVSPSPDSQYLIIAGAFKEQGNAESLVTKLREKGYKAELAGLSKSGLQMVSFGSFGTKEEALEALALIKKKENPGAWLLKK